MTVNKYWTPLPEWEKNNNLKSRLFIFIFFYILGNSNRYVCYFFSLCIILRDHANIYLILQDIFLMSLINNKVELLLKLFKMKWFVEMFLGFKIPIIFVNFLYELVRPLSDLKHLLAVEVQEHFKINKLQFFWRPRVGVLESWYCRPLSLSCFRSRPVLPNYDT